MKIVYIGNFDVLSVGEPEIAHCLEREGHAVIRLDERKTTVQDVKKTISCEKADLLLFAKCRIGTYNEVRDMLNEIEIPSVLWVFDLYWGM